MIFFKSFRVIKKGFNNYKLALFLLILLTFSILFMNTYNKLKLNTFNQYYQVINNIYFVKSINHITNNLNPRYEEVTHLVKSGDSLQKILSIHDISDSEVLLAINHIQKKLKKNKLKIGNKISFIIDRKANVIKNFTLPISKTKKLLMERTINDKFNIKE